MNKYHNCSYSSSSVYWFCYSDGEIANILILPNQIQNCFFECLIHLLDMFFYFMFYGKIIYVGTTMFSILTYPH